MTAGANPKAREDDRRGGGAAGVTGNPAFEVRDGERDKVREWGRVLTARQIGLILRGPAEPVSDSTILRHFDDELKWARANFIADAGGKLVDAVLAGKESSIHFALKVLGEPGQFVERRELTGPRGGPIQTADIALLADLPPDKLKALHHAAAILRGDSRDDTPGTAPVPDAPGPDRSGD